MKFAIIIGSHRKESQSSKVGRYIEHNLKKLDSNNEIFILDLKNNPLPFWSEERWKDDSEESKNWEPYSEELKQCDAFIIISPEWGGMVPAGLKNFFLLCDDYELAHKPALIVAVSGGRGGAYPVAELRMSSYKNSYICYIPEHIIVRKAKEVLNDFELNKENKEDAYIKQRIEYALIILGKYAEALKTIRHVNVLDYKTYPFGVS